MDEFTRSRARELRREQSTAERLLWSRLRRNPLPGVHFRRQHPIGPYFVDFVCVSRGLIVELDGETHTTRTESDERRTRWLEGQGYRVIRFSNAAVWQGVDGVARTILDRLVSLKDTSSSESA